MSDANTPLTRIALVGKSHALWPVALLLQKNLPQSIKLTIVEQPDDPGDIAGLTLPMEHRFHQAIGLTSEDLFRDCDANLALGTDCKNWLEVFAPCRCSAFANGHAWTDCPMRSRRLY